VHTLSSVANDARKKKKEEKFLFFSRLEGDLTVVFAQKPQNVLFAVGALPGQRGHGAQLGQRETPHRRIAALWSRTRKKGKRKKIDFFSRFLFFFRLLLARLSLATSRRRCFRCSRRRGPSRTWS
jgi:hypothetical protein